jgi:hypothetical protein
MELKGRTFKDNKTGQTVEIMDTYQDISMTNKGEKISTSRLLDTNHYTEQLNPEQFLNNNSTYNLFAEKIKSVDLANVPDDGASEGHTVDMSGVAPEYQPATNESAVLQYDPEFEKQQLAEKYGASMDGDAVNRQQEAFSKLLDEGDGGEVVQRGEQQRKPTQTKPKKSEYVQPDHRIEPQVRKPEDPIMTMFKNVKRKEGFTLSIEIDDKIPRADFIEMMEDSYETSIIEYLADDMLNKLLSDPKLLRDKIISNIKDIVYPDGWSDEVVEEVVETEEKTEEEPVEEETVEDEVVSETNPPEPPKDRVIIEGETPPKPNSMDDDK